MQVHEIELDDYHPGEITNFDSSHATLGREVYENGHWPNDNCGAESTHSYMLAGMTVATMGVDDEGNLVDEDSDNYAMTRWVLSGTPSQLREAYHELLSRLSEPAWHWYGMGGDDFCYDYWPNTMRLAADFRDQLIGLANQEWRAQEAADLANAMSDGSYDEDEQTASVPPWDYVYHTQYLIDDLCHIYWLARTRYARPNAPAGVGTAAAANGTVAEADEYFENDILSHISFGLCPSWLVR